MTTDALNVLGEPLEPCSLSPKTGYMRSGWCEFDATDGGLHLVCARVTTEFLTFSKGLGNDLTTAHAAFDFPGLKPGDFWCLCAGRWLEAMRAGVAPPILLAATHQKVLEVLAYEDLLSYALDAPMP